MLHTAKRFGILLLSAAIGVAKSKMFHVEQNERNERAKNENPNVRRRDTISYRANVLR